MNVKTTYILFGVLLGVLGLLLLTQLGHKKTEDETAYVLPSLQEDKINSQDINGVEIALSQPKEEKLVFVRSGDTWELQHPQARADSVQVNQIVSQLLHASKEEKADMTADLAQYGLDSPAAVVTIRKGADQEWKINIGKASIGKENALVYVTSSDHPNEPMAVRRIQLDSVIKNIDETGKIEFKTVRDYRSKYLLAESAFDIVWVNLTDAQHKPLTLEKTSDGRWRYDTPAFGDADYEGESASASTGLPKTDNGTGKNITGVRDLLQTVADLRVESEGDFGATEVRDVELADKGLVKDKEHLRIEIKRQSSTVGSTEKKPPVQEGLLIGSKADDKGEKLYARLLSDRNVVKVPAKKVEELTKLLEKPSALRNRDLLEITDSTKVDAVDIKLNANDTLKLRRTGESAGWKLFDAGKAQSADHSTVQGLLTALTVKRLVKDFPDVSKSDADFGLDKPATAVSIWVEGIKKEEKKEEKKDTKKENKEEKKDTKTKEQKAEKKDAKEVKKEAKEDKAKKDEKKTADAEPALKDQKPTYKLVFGKRAKDIVYVRREAGGEVTRLAVPANLLDKVSAGKLAYLERKLPSVDFASEVSKVVLVRGGETYELEKAKDDKAPAKWKLKQPKALAGRDADAGKVDQLLDELRDLEAEKLVAEKAADTELERYGLKAPSTKVTVTVSKTDKKTEDHVYLFGKETEDKTGVYAKQGERDLVFVVRKSVVDALQGDLRDRTVFSFALGKVKGLKLVGWQDVMGGPHTLDLERKTSQNWVVKSPAEFKLDLSKAESFLSGLSHVRAERFVADKSGAKPEYKLDLKNGALEIAIKLEGEKEPYTLTVGGPSGIEGYYAKSNKLPGEIFLLPKGNFEQVKKMPGYFK